MNFLSIQKRDIGTANNNQFESKTCTIMAVAKVFRVNITISLVPRLGMRLYHNHMLKYFNDHSFIMSCICKLCAYCD